MNEFLKKVQQWAHNAHDSINQKRKYTGEPYWVHPDHVASIVEAETNDNDIIAAAFLHDVLEDVAEKNPQYSEKVMRDLFGNRITNFVIELTNVYEKTKFPYMNRNERKQKERFRLANISKEAKMVKLADIISNIPKIAHHDSNFAKTFIEEKKQLIEVLKDGSESLYKKAKETIEQEIKQLEILL